MAKKNRYREWVYSDDHESQKDFMKILPDGTMLQITFYKDKLSGCELVSFRKPQKATNVQKIFLKKTEVSTKMKWEYALQKAQHTMEEWAS
ncbi:MAG: hypothetical protein EP332_06425 [Bacteroidetes bacterium]|nr:MAG: hypothetical protein EP332_06425 [Bacteroidota bacterium]